MDDAAPPRPEPPLSWRDVLDRAVTERQGRLLAAAGCVAAVAVAVLVAWWALRPPPAPATEASLPYAPGAGGAAPAGSTSSTAAPTTTEPATLVVHAAGAVVAPGVHRVSAGSRVGDLLAAAGGPAPDADLDRVNLAAPLADGERVWFPRVGEDAPPPVAAGTAGAGGAGAGGASGGGSGAAAVPGPVDLNAATAEELEGLPGVGPAIAAAIVEHRERHGPFTSVDGLLEVRGIGPARLEQLRDHVVVR